MTALTPTRRIVLMAIAKHRHIYGYSPTMREIARVMPRPNGGIAFSGDMHKYITRLARDGYLVRTPKIARSYVLTPKGEEALR